MSNSVQAIRNENSNIDPFERRMLAMERGIQFQTIQRVADVVQNRQQHEQHRQEIAKLQGWRTDTIVNCVCGSGKVTVKLGAKEVVFVIAKQFSLETAKKASYITAAKVIPIVSVIVGVGLAIYRYKNHASGDKEELIKAIGEVTSGVFACFPGWGTGVSVLLDGGIGVHDVYRGLHPFSPAPAVSSDLNLQEAYQGLGIQIQDPTRHDVDGAYKSLIWVHPDKHPDASPEQREEYTALMQFVNECRDTIYLERKWN